MKIKDILQRDPAANPLVNQGQARISDTPSSPRSPIRATWRARQHSCARVSSPTASRESFDRSWTISEGRVSEEPGSAASSGAASRTS